MTTIEEKVYTYILLNSPLKLDYTAMAKALNMSKTHVCKIVSQLFSKGSIKKPYDENGDLILVVNSDKTINHDWKDNYIELLETIILNKELDYNGETLTKDTLREFQKMIYNSCL